MDSCERQQTNSRYDYTEAVDGIFDQSTHRVGTLRTDAITAKNHQAHMLQWATETNQPLMWF